MGAANGLFVGRRLFDSDASCSRSSNGGTNRRANSSNRGAEKRLPTAHPPMSARL